MTMQLSKGNEKYVFIGRVFLCPEKHEHDIV